VNNTIYVGSPTTGVAVIEFDYPGAWGSRIIKNWGPAGYGAVTFTNHTDVDDIAHSVVLTRDGPFGVGMAPNVKVDVGGTTFHHGH
jgi:hypothetical protein